MSSLMALTLVIGLGNPGQTQATGSANPLTIIVAVYDYAAVPPGWLRQAQNEMGRIYHEIGVEITWWDPDRSSPVGGLPDGQRDAPSTVPRDALIVLIRHSSVSPQKDLPENVMGSASGTADERGRVAYLFYDRTETFPFLYRARLLGHLMAHEIGHLLLPLDAHSPQGLMRAQWSGADLERALAGRLRFTPEQANLIRSRVAQMAETHLLR